MFKYAFTARKPHVTSEAKQGARDISLVLVNLLMLVSHYFKRHLHRHHHRHFHFLHDTS
jgi:hypothetical protein